MTETTSDTPVREAQVAVVPLNTITLKDVQSGAAVFDHWLREASGGLVTLEGIKSVAGALPVIGNVIALVDAMGDVITLAKTGATQILDWVSLGINLIGVVPMPPNMAAARMSLRPTLFLVRQEVQRQVHVNLGEALITVLTGHLNESIVGEIDDFVSKAQEKLASIMEEAGKTGSDLLINLSDGLDAFADGKLDVKGDVAAAKQQLEDARENLVRDPVKSIKSVWGALWSAYSAAGKAAANEAVKNLLPDDARKLLKTNVAMLRRMAPELRANMTKLAQPGTEKSIGWMLNLLAQAIMTWRAKKAGLQHTPPKALGASSAMPAKPASAAASSSSNATAAKPTADAPGKPGKTTDAKAAGNVDEAKTASSQKDGKGTDSQKDGKGEPKTTDGKDAAATSSQDSASDGNVQGAQMPANVRTQGTTEARHTATEGKVEAQGNQQQAEKDAGNKNCTCTGTRNSISFARGTEQLNHSDFSLPGPFPLDWTRTYRSSLSAYDTSLCGARWITAYTTRIDVVHSVPDRSSLMYHAADGRSHDYPLPAIGKTHYDPIENLTLVRTSEDELTLAQGYARWETYQRHGDSFRLTEIRLRNGACLRLYYEHLVDGRQVLSDLITYQDDQVHTQLGTQLDDAGLIIGLWQIADGELKRQLARYEYSVEGDLWRAWDEHSAHWTYRCHNHLITRYTDRTGRGMNLQWQGDGPDARAVREWADDGSFDTKLEWDKNIRLTYVTDALGNETWHYYDILGYTYRIVHPDGLSEWLMRDSAKNVVKHIHPDGTQDRYAYDDRSNLLEHIRADGSVVHFAYDDKDQLFKISDAEGGLWKRDYDPRGNLIETIDPLGNKTEYAYNTLGLPVAITDAKGGQKLVAYDADGRMTQYTDCSGKSSAWKYDTLGQLVAFTDAQGNTRRYTYAAGQLQCITHPDGTQERFERDAEGRLLVHIDALDQRTSWDYTAAGLIAQRTNAAGHTLAYQWDKLGQLTALSNENDKQARFAYDPVGRLLQETGFDDASIRYRYDPATGRLTDVEEGDRRLSVTFDAIGRLVKREARTRTTTSAATPLTESFRYNANGQLVLAENTDSRLQWFYDAAGNLVHEHQHYQSLASPIVAVWKHEYDALNQRIATVRPDGHRVSWLTYGSGHVHGMTFDGHELVNFERDDLHREVQRQQGNRLIQTQAWDAMGRLSEQALAREPGTAGSLANTRPGSTSGQRLLQRQYRYDAVGQLEAIHDSRRGPLAYRYDPVGHLLEAVSGLGKETFAFDPAGNPLDPAKTYPQETLSNAVGPVYTYRRRSAYLDNLLREYAGTHYRYDARGNLIEKLHNGERTQMQWDLFNRLIGFRNDTLEVSYHYDALGRRLIKHSQALYRERASLSSLMRDEERRRLNQSLGCGMTLYGWDGDTLAWEGYNDLVTHYVYEPGSFVPLAQATSRQPLLTHRSVAYAGAYDIDKDPLWTGMPTPDPVDVLAWYQCDHLGTPQELTDEQGDIVWSAQYKAWGEAREVITQAAQSAGIRNPIRFQGQYHDHETGLHYNRHRYYDPQTGRFIGKDPIGYAGGLNLYQYAPNPIGWIDPLGLAKRGPKTNGAGPHNEAIAAWGREAEAAGGSVRAGGGKEKEILIPTPGGNKEGRRPDIIIDNADGTTTYGNVGRVKADGSPVPREVSAMEDLRTKTVGEAIPDDIQFRSYCPCSIKGKK